MTYSCLIHEYSVACASLDGHNLGYQSLVDDSILDLSYASKVKFMMIIIINK